MNTITIILSIVDSVGKILIDRVKKEWINDLASAREEIFIEFQKDKIKRDMAYIDFYLRKIDTTLKKIADSIVLGINK
jgi:hypothetical protein